MQQSVTESGRESVQGGRWSGVSEASGCSCVRVELVKQAAGCVRKHAQRCGVEASTEEVAWRGSGCLLIADLITDAQALMDQHSMLQ